MMSSSVGGATTFMTEIDDDERMSPSASEGESYTSYENYEQRIKFITLETFKRMFETGLINEGLPEFFAQLRKQPGVETGILFCKEPEVHAQNFATALRQLRRHYRSENPLLKKRLRYLRRLQQKVYSGMSTFKIYYEREKRAFHLGMNFSLCVGEQVTDEKIKKRQLEGTVN